MSHDLQHHLDAFDALRVAGPFAYARASTHGEARHPAHVVFGCMVHGDETGSLPGVVEVMRRLSSGELRFGGKVTFFIGNPEAGHAGQRFLESDLNRVFHDGAADDHEGRRARELRPILDAADVFIDLHQTILDVAQPFYIMPFQIPAWHWARALGTARVWVTRHPEAGFSLSGCCADEYVRLQGRPGITIEVGRRGFGNGGEERAFQAITDTLRILDEVADGASLAAIAEAQPEIEFFETIHREPFTSDALALRPGIVNFHPVTAGETLSAEASVPLVAPASGAVLFPKYPPRLADGSYKKPLPAEIYRIVVPLTEHPLDKYGLRR